MKKALSLILLLALCLALCSCGSSENTATQPAQSKQTTAPAETTQPVEETTAPTEAVTVYKPGDVITTELFEITPVFTGYARELSNWPDENYMTPAGKFSGESPYSAVEGKVAIYGEVLVTYIGSEKSDVTLKLDISVDYDNGFIFDKDAADYGYCFSVDGDWQYDNVMTFEPLSDKNTRILRYCVQVPEQVETNTDKSLSATFLVNDQPYVFDFRSAEVLGSDYDPRDVFYGPIDDATKQQIITYLKTNGLKQSGWYDTTVGVYTFTFGDTDVTARLPINSSYAYDFEGTYEVFSGSILISWSYGEQMHLDYTFDGTTLTVTDFAHGR